MTDIPNLIILVSCTVAIICGIILLLTRRRKNPSDLNKRALAQSEADRALLLRELDQKEFAVGYILESKKRSKFSDQELATVNEIEARISRIKSALAGETFRHPNTDCGYVYVISNPSFRSGIVKIGMTNAIDPGERIKGLYNTSTPVGFDAEIVHYSEDAYKLEQKLHRIFNSSRVNPKREFFFLSPIEVRERLLKSEGSIVYLNPEIFIEGK